MNSPITKPAASSRSHIRLQEGGLLIIVFLVGLFLTLFGGAVDRPDMAPPSPRELFGYATHHALRARFCIERGRVWQAEYWISSARALRFSLPASATTFQRTMVAALMTYPTRRALSSRMRWRGRWSGMNCCARWE
jgi:hypothetical protein